MATTHRILPPTPDLDQLRRDAKSLLKALRADDPAARARVHAVASGLPVRLSTAQLVVAREHGVDSWPQLKELVDRVVAQGTRYDVIRARRRRLSQQLSRVDRIDRCHVQLGLRRKEAAQRGFEL